MLSVALKSVFIVVSYCGLNRTLLYPHIFTEQYLLHKLVYAELDADHGHDGRESRRQCSIKGPHPLLTQHFEEAVRHSVVVGDDARPVRLRDDARLDCVDGNHDTARTRRCKASDECVFKAGAGAALEGQKGQLELLEEHPGEGVGGDLLHNGGQPAAVKATPTLSLGDCNNGEEEVVVHARHDAIRDDHLRRGHDGTDKGRDCRRDKVEERIDEPFWHKHGENSRVC